MKNMVVNALPRERNYTIWEASKLGTEGTKRYLCFRTFNNADRDTVTAIQNSMFMYGFFKGDEQDYGMACWYAVLTDESREFAELTLAGATYTKPGDKVFNGGKE